MIGGTRIELPYALIHRVLGNQYRTPMRFMTPAVLAWTMVVCLTLDRSVFRWKRLVDRVNVQRALVGRLDGVAHLGLSACSIRFRSRPCRIIRRIVTSRRRPAILRCSNCRSECVPALRWWDAVNTCSITRPFISIPFSAVIYRACRMKCLDYFYSDPLLGALTLSHGLPPQAEVDAQLSAVDSRCEHRLCGLAPRSAGAGPGEIVRRFAESTAVAGEGRRRRPAGDLQGTRQVARCRAGSTRACAQTRGPLGMARS